MAKRNLIYWKSFQYKKADIEDIFGGCNKFSDVNVGIVTGNISKLAVIDVDDINLLAELEELLPEIKETTRVRTRRGYHYYFSLNGEYVFEIPLSEVLPIPKILIKKKKNPASQAKDKKYNTFKIPKYHGQKVDCIRQVLNRDLQEGERNSSLFILYNLLLQNKNTEEYSKKIVIEKNRSLLNPLTELDLKKV